MTQGEIARGLQGSHAARAISPCVTDDRLGGRRVPPNTPAAPPLSRLDRVLRRLAAGHLEPRTGLLSPPRLRLVREPGVDPVGAGLVDPGLVDLYERHVPGALEAVEIEERQCIELTYFTGLSVDEVAARCEMSPAAVDDRLRRGLNGMLRYLRACARREAGTQA